MASRQSSAAKVTEALKALRDGKSAADAAASLGISESTVRRWQRDFEGIEPERIDQFAQVRAENARLRKIVVQQAMDIDALKDLVSRKWSDDDKQQ